MQYLIGPRIHRSRNVPIPFWLKPISKIRAPFAPNPCFSFPDFPPENLFSQAHFLWQSHTYVQRVPQNPADEKNASAFFELKGKPMTGNKKENREPAGGTFHVPSNKAENTPRSARDTRNALRFPEKSVHNKSPLSIPTYTDPSNPTGLKRPEEEKGGISRPSKGPQ